VQASGKWAFEGKLEDLSDILLPIKSACSRPNPRRFSITGQTKNKAYYGFPLKQQRHARSDLERHAGKGRLQASDIRQMGRLLVFLVRQGWQAAIAKATGQRIFGIGQPMGVNRPIPCSRSTRFMDAYKRQAGPMTTGKLLVDDPKVRDGLIHALKDYTDTYIKGCTPPSSTTWKDRTNNVAFHNKTTVMTHNFTISIAAKWFEIPPTRR